MHELWSLRYFPAEFSLSLFIGVEINSLVLLAEILFRCLVSVVLQKLVQQEKLVTQKIVQDALDILRGAVTIVYPMGLPPHDIVRQEFENTEDLSGTQASLEVIIITLE